MTEDIQNRIREMAYMRESTGRQQDMALECWLAAEREVLAIMQAAAERLMPPPDAKKDRIGSSGTRRRGFKPDRDAGRSTGCGGADRSVCESRQAEGDA